jgi:putative salt-induced outer membrane protein YdiY
MRARVVTATVFAVLVVVCSAHSVFAQAPAEPPKIWTVTASAGLALTSGNSNTSTVNLGYDLTYDPQTKNVIKSDGLYIRGETEGELSTHRTGINIRDEYKLTDRIFVFGQNQFLKDQFKEIDYLVAPTGGVGYKIIDTATTKFGVDGSVGVVWEKNPGFDVNSSGALATGEKLTHQLTGNTALSQTFMGLWKTDDLEDALFTFGVSIAASMSTRTQLKVEALDTFKNKPPLPTIQANDVAVLVSIVYKM